MTQPIAPDVSNVYMVLGYAAVVLIGGGLVAFVMNRTRRLRQEYRMLITLEREESANSIKT